MNKSGSEVRRETRGDQSAVPNLTTQAKTKTTLQAAHTYNSPTENTNRDVQQLTISILHTKKVSTAGPGGVKEHAASQVSPTRYIPRCCLVN